MIESGSSLFYLLHCSTHDRLNTMTFRSFRNIPHGLHRQNPNRYWPRPCFASAHPARIASPELPFTTRLIFFASAHPARIASDGVVVQPHVVDLCLSTSRTDCIHTRPEAKSTALTLPQHIPHGLHPFPSMVVIFRGALPQHIPHGLHQQNRTDAMPQIHAIYCELVDSFSDAAKAASALTIFQCSSTVKAIYIAIIDSLGRTIDRFFGANRTEKVC